MKLYVIRHTETEWNITGQAQGHVDSPITERGVQQAAELADKLRPLAGEIKAFYSSDLGRCVYTASVVGESIGKTAILTEKLRERNYGDYTGWKKEDVWKIADINDLDFQLPNGESAKQLADRVDTFLSELDEVTTLCVVHDGVIRHLLSRSLGIHPYSPEAMNEHGIVHEFSLTEGVLKYAGPVL